MQFGIFLIENRAGLFIAALADASKRWILGIATLLVPKPETAR